MVANMNENERSAAIDLISNINQYVSTVSIVIKRAGGETTINNSQSADARKIMFPDVLLYADDNKNLILQGWELKMPDVSVFDTAYIEDAQFKADKLGLNSTVLWNFHDVVLYVKDNGNWVVKKQWNNLNSITSRIEVKTKESIWKNFLKQFLVEINNFYISGEIVERELSEISQNVISYLISDFKNDVAAYLKSESQKNRLIDIEISNWWLDSKNEYLMDEYDGYVAYSKNVILNWLTRFIFGHIIMETHNIARELENISFDTHPDEVNNIFKRITKTSDFYTIFEPQKYNEYLPRHVWHRFIEFNTFLNGKYLPHEMLQKLLETSIAQFKREIIGQYTTPEKLAKLLVYSTVLNIEDHSIDPCCGTGIIPKVLMELMINSNMTEREAHDKIWASDKMLFPLQVANMTLTTQTSMNLINKVFQKNVFSLSENTKIKIVSPETGNEIEYELPKYKNIVSNLPFVPFEIIDESENSYINEINNEVYEFSNKELILDRRSDFYFYIVLYLNKILANNGRVGVVTSNSWLGTQSGKKFYKALSLYYNIKAIIISGRGRWFPNAEVMSSILILEKKETQRELQTDKVQFALLCENLDNLTDEDIRKISNNLLISSSNEILQITEYATDKIEQYMGMNLSLNSLFYNVSWIDELEGQLISISNVFSVIRGMRRGWDELFYPDNESEIENCYLKPILKSSRSINSYETNTDGMAFCCSKTLNELKLLGHFGAINWIKRFEFGVNKVGRPLKEVLETNDLMWYEMRTTGAVAEFVTSLNPGERLFWAKLENPSFINQRLIGLNRKKANDNVELLHALLNSVIGLFLIEASGFGRGLGALDLSKNNIQKMQMLNPYKLNEDEVKKILYKFSFVKKYEIGDTISMLELEERIDFDKCVLESYGLLDRYMDIKDGLINMLNARLSV
ncbi:MULTISPECIES: N-6 DNA methylase [unclassified Enterococcus]|uniref:N-6 DNA methylase n=1 Tax=unclassified Enterococcus TaxID=2608891 RepID=UPI001CE06D33|nr:MULTISPECIES: N-6 DNA methylase [unclassified Enterococcus]MCA5011951.1 N-6 DNA methylase [Enterococcus sp. S23]MCA5014607.1 N-6 DNA methylase [Enterococcus sp. S22(2020)]